jgi:glycosyltransferase involved in cell wall biosynthesis
MAVHFRVSEADEYVESNMINPNGRVFRAIRDVERQVIPRVDGWVAVTAWARDALLNWLPEAASVPGTVIGNFTYAEPPDVDRTPLGDLVTVGRLEPVKNHHFLLEVLAESKRRGRPYTLDIYGQGPCQAHLSALAMSLGVDDLVRFRGFRRDVRRCLPRYRAYIHAATSESSSLAIMEAMAAGLPVVAGYLAPLAELLDEGVEGRFFPAGDVIRAATVVTSLLDREETSHRAAEAARTRFQRDFDADVVVPRLLSFLEGTDHPKPPR